MIADAAVRQMMRRRGTMLKFIRQGHEKQLSRMDDFDIYGMMQDVGMQMGRKEIITMLQDLCVIGYIKYVQSFDEEHERTKLSEIELTPQGLAVTVRRKSNDEVLFD